jgi:cell division protein FtsB
MQGFVFIVVFAIVAWYYYHRFRESEVEYFKLHKKMSEVKCENVHLKERISDLELYKQDVSKTFKILDNELLGINEHIKNRSIQQQTIPVQINEEDGGEVEPSQRISILTPEMLGQLFHSMQNEQEHFIHVQNTSASVEEIKQDERDEQEHEQTSTLNTSLNTSLSNMNNFEKYLIE